MQSLGPLGAGARAGLRPGDVLLSWKRGTASGPLRSCADFSAAEVEQTPRGAVELRVLRDGRVSPVELPAGEWQTEVDGDGACPADARARRLAREQRWAEACTAWAEALRQPGKPLYKARVLRERGVCLTALEDFAEAEAAIGESLRVLRQAAPGSLEEAASWHALGRLEQRRGAYTRSEEHLRRALALRARLAPESLERASTLNNLGIDAWYLGDLGRARALYVAALAIVRQRAPGGQDEARVLNNLGLLARASGDLAGAESHLAEAARIWQRLDPASPDLARTYSNLGALAADRGDFSLSEEHYRKALKRLEAISPGSLEIASLYKNLGMNARDQGDYPEAETLIRRALAIEQDRAPGTAQEATSLNTLSWIVQERGRLGEAEDLARQALAIRSRILPGSTDTAISLSTLGAIAARRGDLRTAMRLGEQGLALQRKIAPGSMPESHITAMLGSVALARKRWDEAERWARHGLAIIHRLSPQSWAEARTLDILGVALAGSGRPDEARAAFAAAVDALEKQDGRISGSDVSRSGMQARFAEIYRNFTMVDLETGDPAAALQTLERWRARTLLAQAVEHALARSPGVPPALRARQRQLEREYEETQEALAGADPRRDAEVEELRVRLSRLRSERSAVVDAMVRASPRYASLRYTRPLDLAAARRALDPGTVWLSYLVTKEKAFLFVVTPSKEGETDELQVFRLPVDGKTLAEEVAVFRGLILHGRGKPAAEPALLVQARKLYGLLIAPAEPWIERAGRVLISPDDPLHTLPFAALVRPGEPARFLVEWKPVHTVLSATLYAELKRGRRGGSLSEGGGGPLVAFAAPRLPAATGRAAGEDDPPLRRYRAGLPPLPGAREEVRALAGLYGENARVYTGTAATEARVRDPGMRPRILHFASHALLDRRSPLDSGLALAPSGSGGDGLLQAWEIFEQLRLDADLVTLSACGTGLGREAAGEGLIGLTRAFQFAGARSVLASLWTVPDRSTAVLMTRFYAGLRAGLPKDEALARAQRQLLQSQELAHPYSWAGFTLNGDWR